MHGAVKEHVDIALKAAETEYNSAPAGPVSKTVDGKTPAHPQVIAQTLLSLSSSLLVLLEGSRSRRELLGEEEKEGDDLPSFNENLFHAENVVRSGKIPLGSVLQLLGLAEAVERSLALELEACLEVGAPMSMASLSFLR